MKTRIYLLFTFLIALSNLSANHHSNASLKVGLARVDITPDEPIRLSGYGGRRDPSEGVEGKLWTKALAIGEGDGTVLLVTMDLIGIPDWLKANVVKELGIPESNIALCASHTHSGPHLKDVLNPIFMADIPEDHWATIERYSAKLTSKVVAACRMALNNRQAGKLAWGQGEVGFSGNRRVLENGIWTGFGTQPDGPVDHSVPLLKITNDAGELIGLLANYACHCTTLGGDMNKIHGDWAGETQRLLEERHPGITAMIAIGCGADSNPNPRGSMEEVLKNSKLMANEVDRLLKTSLEPLTSIPTTVIDHITLPLDPLPSRQYWEEHAASNDKTAYYGKLILDRLDRGEVLPTSIDYPIQTWTFGNDLAMVFLAGEVVVDYSIKLKERFDKNRIWINAYANAAPSYIASRRLYDEGGYEVDRSMLYYDKPTRLSPDTEDLVLDEVLQQLPHTFYSKKTLSRIPAPVEKDQALATMVTHPDVQVELVAAEPLVMDPIDMAWGADGRMWVVEMADYPLGIDGNGKAGGRVRVLSDENGDGIYDRSTLFLEGLPFPTSVLPWRDGVLITTPPDLLFARDTDGNEKADEVRALYTGFYLGNQQHLANGMQYGLDGWIYLANGDSGGEVHSWNNPNGVRIDNLDIRIRPEEGKIETILGRTQFGRNRDNWGNWFGNSNSWPGWHYALDDHYLERNPHIAYPNAKAYLPEVPQAGPVYPVSKTLSRYNDYEKSNRFTSACGFMIYEDDALGKAFTGNSFISEPVHNLVSRGVVSQNGSSFASKRAPEEKEAEFLASTDNWFRPTAIRSGPDGALYIADMYRLVIEHPEWVPPDWQRKLNLREGHDKGRIYRVFGKGEKLRTAPDLTRLKLDELVEAMDSNNRWQRDSVQQLLLWKADNKTINGLKKIASNGKIAAARVQALWTLHCLKALSPEVISEALKDADPRVLKNTVALSEPFLNTNPEIAQQVLTLADKNDAPLQQQVSYTLGDMEDGQASSVWAKLMVQFSDDPLIRSALLSSLVPHLKRVMESHGSDLLKLKQKELTQGLIQTAIGSGNRDAQNAILRELQSMEEKDQFSTFAILLESLEQRGKALKFLYEDADPELKSNLEGATKLFGKAAEFAADASQSTSARKEALNLLAYPRLNGQADRSQLLKFLSPTQPVELQLEAVKVLKRQGGGSLTTDLMQTWNSQGPAVRKQIIESLLDSYDSTADLLEYGKDHQEILSLFSAAQVATLSTHRSPYIRELAKSLFKATVSENRLQVIDSFKPALSLTGDAKAGRSHFEARCSICHKMDDVGNEVGPDLTSLTDKSLNSLLAAIIDPNRSIEDKFAQYTITDKNGKSLAGIIARESANSVTLLNAGGIEQTLLRSQIDNLEGGSRSLMPEGLELGLDNQGMADLLAYLASSGSGTKITPTEDGSLTLPAARGLVSGPSAYFNPASDAIEWVADTDEIQWTAYNLKAGYYDIFSDASMAVEYEGRPFILEVNDNFITGTVIYSRGINNFRKRKFGNITIEEDLPVAVFKLSHRLDGPQMSLKELRLIPVK
jgi:putative membrane-bound dehydrogenase-like protein